MFGGARGVCGYALQSIARRWQINRPLYVSIGAAAGLPLVVLLLNSAIETEGRSLLGATSETRFLRATHILSGMGLVVGMLQIALLMSRLLRDRGPEFRYLVSAVMNYRQLFTTTFVENLLHTAIGWMLGCVAAMVALGVTTLMGLSIKLSSPTDLGATAALVYLSLALAVAVPSMGLIFSLHFKDALRPGRW